MMKKIYTVILIFFSVFNIYSQDIKKEADSGSYENKFISANLKEKLEIINTVNPAEESFELYKTAIKYTAANMESCEEDSDIDKLYTKSVSGMLFILNNSSLVRKKTEESEIIEFLDFISTKVKSLFLPYLYRMKNMNYSKEIIKRAEYIFNNADFPLFSTASAIIVDNPVMDKLEIFKTAISSSSLSPIAKGELSLIALEISLNYTSRNHREAGELGNLMNKCIDVIYELRWSEASYLVIEYFDYLLAYEDKDIVRKDLLKTIKTLGILGTHEAAIRLSMYISVINSFTDQGLEYDEEILKEVILSLGQIGDLAAYENLSNMENLNYSREVLELSKQALSKLKISG